MRWEELDEMRGKLFSSLILLHGAYRFYTHLYLNKEPLYLLPTSG